jgi:hypothetical protein
MGTNNLLAAIPEGASPPFRAVKVSLPYAQVRRQIHQTRAALVTTAILTIFAAVSLLFVFGPRTPQRVKPSD